MTFPVNFCSSNPISFMVAEGIEIQEFDAVEFQFPAFSIFYRKDKWELEYTDAEEGSVTEVLEDSVERFTEDRELLIDGAIVIVKVEYLEKAKNFLFNRGENK